jgi:hypothetical protein
MSLFTARQKFEESKELARTGAEAKIAEGLIELARGIGAELTQLKRDVQEVKARVNSLKNR